MRRQRLAAGAGHGKFTRPGELGMASAPPGEKAKRMQKPTDFGIEVSSPVV